VLTYGMCRGTNKNQTQGDSIINWSIGAQIARQTQATTTKNGDHETSVSQKLIDRIDFHQRSN
jgi:hypothetical protein